MSYLITGATGLVGSEILRLCEQQNIVVHYLTIRKSQLKETEFLKGFYWNPSKKEIDKAAFKGVTCIIHLAGATVAKRWTALYKNKIINSRIQSANLIAETLKNINHQVTQFISASAIGIYNDSLTDFHKEASTDLSNSFLGKVVKSWENIADQFKHLGIKVAKIRIGLVLSDKGGALTKLANPIKMCVGSGFGKGNQWQSWIHLSDLGRLFLYVAKNNLEGVYNATAPNPVTQSKLIRTCAEILDKPLWLPNIPDFVAKIMFGEMSTLLLDSHRVCSKKIIDRGFNFSFNTIESAIENLLQEEAIIRETTTLLP